MNIKAKFLATSLFTLTTLFSTASFANNDQAQAKAEFEAMMKEYKTAVESALKSPDIRGGLIKACGIQYKRTVTLKLLTQAEVSKLCTCTIDTEGKVTESQKWEIQSAINSKNQAKIQQLQTSIVKKQGESVKQCVGSALDQKLAKLAQQAQAQAAK